MKTGFIGGGKMAEAIIGSLVGAKTLGPQEIFASDMSEERRRILRSRYGVNVYSRNDLVVDEVKVLFLAVKPQDLDDVLAQLAPEIGKRHLVVSIAAGKTLAWIESRLPRARVVRVMPNLACLVQESMSAYCAGARATQADRRNVTRLLASFGEVLELPEEAFDVVTALSGSGPAFLAYFLDAMIEAGVAEGLERSHAVLLAEQTMRGTSRLLMERNMEPQDLIRDVASPKGTTEAGLTVLGGSDVKVVVAETIRAAARRSQELSS